MASINQSECRLVKVSGAAGENCAPCGKTAASDSASREATQNGQLGIQNSGSPFHDGRKCLKNL